MKRCLSPWRDRRSMEGGDDNGILEEDGDGELFIIRGEGRGCEG